MLSNKILPGVECNAVLIAGMFHCIILLESCIFLGKGGTTMAERQAGHRQRLRNRYRRTGFDGFEPHEILEMVLHYAIPRVDTKETARELLRRFGSLSQVLDASPEMLEEIPGIGPNAVLFLKLLPELFRLYASEKANSSDKSGTYIQTVEQAGAFVLPQFIGRTNEVVLLVCLDNKGKVLSSQVIFEGVVNGAPVTVRKIVEAAVNQKASAILLAHNHPGGFALPSNADMAATKTIRTAVEAMGVHFFDHIVVAQGDFTSMRDSGILL